MNAISTPWRDWIAHPPALHVPRLCDDAEVQEFFESYFVDFRSDQPRAFLSPDTLFSVARALFGDRRCIDVEIATH